MRQGEKLNKNKRATSRPQEAIEVVSMDVRKIVRRLKEKLHSAQDKLALTILMWLEKEPSQDRVLSAAATGDCSGPYVRYRERSRLKAGARTSKRMSEKKLA